MQDKQASLLAVINYMKSHWPSQVKPEWQVSAESYPAIAKKVAKAWAKSATKTHEFARIAGLSGSGKTTQLLPAVEAHFEKAEKRPILVAARKFVEFHPFFNEIKNEYGEANLRKMTDEFSSIMMFLVLFELINDGYDIILDVTLLDPKMEAILVQMLTESHYDAWLTMVAVSPEITEKFLGERSWRHTKETEQEFIRATSMALKFYQETAPDMHIILWNVWDIEPIYDGKIKSAFETWEKYNQINSFEPKFTENDLREAKIRYLASNNF